MAKKKWGGFRSQREQTKQQQLQMAQQSRNPASQQVQEIQLEGRFYTGPIPEPQALAEYERINAGLANRIVAMAEKEQGYRHRIGNRRNWAQIWITATGQLFGFLVAVMTIGIGGFLLYHDKQLAGFTSLVSGVVMLAAAFVYRRNRSRSQPSPQSVL